MMFFTADWHLGEDRFGIMCRPFDDVAEHVECLIEKHNKLVSPDDLVYVNGDVIYQKADPEIYLPIIHRFNGRKVLIRGNHDRHISNEQFEPYFEKIIDEKEGMEIDVRGIPCYLVHYPTLGRTDRFNLVGHVHGSFRVQMNALNVGVDVHHFSPISELQVELMYNAIVKYYDSDIWAAYHVSNASFLGSRNFSSYIGK